MAEHKGAGSDNQEADEAQRVGQAASQNGSSDQMQQGEHDHLLVVRCATSGRQAHDLQCCGEFHGQHQHARAGEQPPDLDHEQHDRRQHGELPESGLLLPALGNGECQCQRYHQRRAHPATELAACHERQQAESGQSVGHQPMDEAESHEAPCGTADLLS